MLDPRNWIDGLQSMSFFIVVLAAVYSLDVTYLSWKWRHYRNSDWHVTFWMDHRGRMSIVLLFAALIRMPLWRGDGLVATCIAVYLITTFVVVPLVERN